MELKNEELKTMVENLIEWIGIKMKTIGGKKMILGISGGKDSSVVAALGVKALGRENVLGVLMPRGNQADIDYAYELCQLLDIQNTTVPIDSIFEEYIKSLENIDSEMMPELSKDTKINLSPRIRMSILYGISQSIDHSRVVHTGNLSERWIGYTTVYGDNTGAFSPLGNFTSDEVIQIGRYLNLPEKFIVKPPADGLTGKTDEMVLGFSYETLNKYIRTGEIHDLQIKEKIDRMHRYTEFKFNPIPVFENQLDIKI